MLWGYVIPSNQDVVCNVMGMGDFKPMQRMGCSFLYLVDYIVSYSYCKLTIIFSIPNSTCQSSILFLVSIYILHSSS